MLFNQEKLSFCKLLFTLSELYKKTPLALTRGVFRCRSHRLVGAGGFGPPKRNATDLQSAPFGHSGMRPFNIL